MAMVLISFVEWLLGFEGTWAIESLRSDYPLGVNLARATPRGRAGLNSGCSGLFGSSRIHRLEALCLG